MAEYLAAKCKTKTVGAKLPTRACTPIAALAGWMVGKTVVTLRQLHPTAARREEVIGFGAVELGYQTLDKLAAHMHAR